MNRINILDCTLRDGGYCNQWEFGYENIKKITNGLVTSGIDVIECGFLTDKVTYDKDVSKFTTLKEIGDIIPVERGGKLFVAMVNYGEYNIDKLPNFDGTSIDGLRVAFHKKDIDGALDMCQAIKEKGYKVFVQPMVSLCYTDEEFIQMIRRVNTMEPYAFYIVDSFGMMKRKDLLRLFYMVEHNLKDNIWIGFHSHNNMQLAYSNAQSLIDEQTNRDLILDSSIYGMGRGAGNLNTELFVEYLNENAGKTYQVKPLLTIVDEILNGFYQQNYWGYSLPNYLSAAYRTHPNYASYLDDKKTLTVESMAELFALMEESKRYEFDKAYIEELYLRYMAAEQVHDMRRMDLKEKLKGKKVLLVAPGRSSYDEKDKIIKFSKQEDVITISINMEYQYADTDFIFLSNMRRLRELKSDVYPKCIVTSNISADGVYLKTCYGDLVNKEVAVKDNAGMMAIKFMMQMGVENIYLAGFDGYSHDAKENYADDYVAYVTRNAILDEMNTGMGKVLADFMKQAHISFLTEQKYLKIDKGE